MPASRSSVLKPGRVRTFEYGMVGVNSRLHWTPRAGRNAYLVVNYGREEFGGDLRESSWTVALKYNHDLRF